MAWLRAFGQVRRLRARSEDKCAASCATERALPLRAWRGVWQPVPQSWELREEQAANAANLQVDLVLNDKLEALEAEQVLGALGVRDAASVPGRPPPPRMWHVDSDIL